jgi:hypothetical protein
MPRVRVKASSRHRSDLQPFLIQGNKMNAAISYPQITLETLEANEPISRDEGNIGRADMEARDIKEIKATLAVLDHEF